MKAVVKFDNVPDAVEIRDVPEPETVPAGKVLLRVQAASVCGSDVHMWKHKASWTMSVPLILGHEFCGTVEAVGEGVTGVSVGERVACETAAWVCGKCVYCRSGLYNVSPCRKGYGAMADGAFTRFVVARPEILHRLPEGLPFEQAALTEPTCVALNGLLERGRIKPGDLVVVLGPGPIGLMSTQVARVCGAGEIVLVGLERDKPRLELGLQLGATRLVNLEKDDAVKCVQSLRDGFGADVVVDTTGVSASFQTAMDLVRPLGQIVKIGWGPQPLHFNLDPMVQKAVTVHGSFSHNYGTWERALGLIVSGAIQIPPMISAVLPLEEWHEGFEGMEQGRLTKVVLIPR
jgi:alcohol dehydrogenase/L-iditol 2-dehydrogenase